MVYKKGDIVKLSWSGIEAEVINTFENAIVVRFDDGASESYTPDCLILDERGEDMTKQGICIAFDSGGGITIWSESYAHSYDGGSISKQAAEDVQLLLNGGDINQWDGNDGELLAALTEDEIAKYERVYTVAEIAGLLQAGSIVVDGDELSIGKRLVNGYSESEFFKHLT